MCKSALCRWDDHLTLKEINRIQGIITSRLGRKNWRANIRNTLFENQSGRSSIPKSKYVAALKRTLIALEKATNKV